MLWGDEEHVGTLFPGARCEQSAGSAARAAGPGPGPTGECDMTEPDLSSLRERGSRATVEGLVSGS